VLFLICEFVCREVCLWSDVVVGLYEYEGDCCYGDGEVGEEDLVL